MILFPAADDSEGPGPDPETVHQSQPSGTGSQGSARKSYSDSSGKLLFLILIYKKTSEGEMWPQNEVKSDWLALSLKTVKGASRNVS